MTYREAISYLNSFTNYEKNTQYSYKKDFKLARLRNFLLVLGNPQDVLRVIHVAGTKGKGSTCAFVAHILRESGFSVGLYTSPHLNDFRERIRILRPVTSKGKRTKKSFEGMISKKILVALVKELKPLVNKCNRNLKYGQLTFFEIYTALAFLYFKRKHINFVVLETGLGGRLDATNVAQSLVCGITPISLEHVQQLGHTLGKIAQEKAGIIKHSGAIVISAAQEKKVQAVISDRCKKFQAKLYEVGKEIKYVNFKKKATISTKNNNYKNLNLNLIGEHQIANAALAIGLVEALNSYGVNLKFSAIRQGIKNTIWPGRCELLQRDPLVVLDGAQNLASARVLVKTIRDNFKYRKLILVLGISSDKDIFGICKTFNPLADEIILTQAATPRATDPVELAGYFKRKLHLTFSVKEAKLLAQNLASENDLILVTGSLFVVGEFSYA